MSRCAGEETRRGLPELGAGRARARAYVEGASWLHKIVRVYAPLHPSHMKHVLRKRFGQHFLTDGGIIDAIIETIDPKPGQAMVEIGPALLRQPLVERLGVLL